jgi:hypothetical protein
MTKNYLETLKRAIRDEVIEQTHRDGPVKGAFDAMIAAGGKVADVEAELERAMFRCMSEVSHGLPDRSPAVWQALAEGKTTADLFPSASDEDYP